MLRKIAITAVSALALGTGAALAEGAAHIEDFAFSFEGPFGKFDEHQLQRGLQVYTEVCSACHGMKQVRIGELAEEGGPRLPEDQVRAYAATLTVVDRETGEERPATPADKFPANTGAGAPDLSLMAKARAAFHGPYGLGINQLFKGIGGPEYIHAIMTGYHEAPACAPADFPGTYNAVFANGGIPDSCKDEEGHATISGSWIAMPAPLAEGGVTYQDGTEATVEQMAEDVSAFLMWAAEPKMMARKQAGFLAVLFLGLIATLLYLTNKRLWAGVKGKKSA